MILLDTHVLVWLDQGSHQLGSRSLALVDEALKSSELFVCAISFWEIAMLVEKGRLVMQMKLENWRQSLLDNGLNEVDLSGDIAIQSAQLRNFHGDPVDRMIVATAIDLTATLCTADTKILTWAQDLGRLDAHE